MPVTIGGSPITGQADIDSYVAAYVELCLALVNDLAIDRRQGRPVTADAGLGAAFADLAAHARMRHHDVSSADVDTLTAVAHRLHGAVDACLAGDLHAAAGLLNAVLAEHGAVPNLHARPDDLPRLAFH